MISLTIFSNHQLIITFLQFFSSTSNGENTEVSAKKAIEEEEQFLNKLKVCACCFVSNAIQTTKKLQFSVFESCLNTN